MSRAPQAAGPMPDFPSVVPARTETYVTLPDRRFWTPSGLPMGYFTHLRRFATPSGLPRPVPGVR